VQNSEPPVLDVVEDVGREERRTEQEDRVEDEDRPERPPRGDRVGEHERDGVKDPHREQRRHDQLGTELEPEQRERLVQPPRIAALAPWDEGGLTARGCGCDQKAARDHAGEGERAHGAAHIDRDEGAGADLCRRSGEGMRHGAREYSGTRRWTYI
jgi:hypothetical protein